MSNTYYMYHKIGKSYIAKYDLHETISLTVEENGELLLEINNSFPDPTTVSTTANISLTEKEQDELIAGILERRGLTAGMAHTIVNGVFHMANIVALKSLHAITATDTAQSRIHPALFISVMPLELAVSLCNESGITDKEEMAWICKYPRTEEGVKENIAYLLKEKQSR